jgi:integrase/recombinase XerD
VSELVKLRLSDINFEAGYLTTVGKGGKQRLVPLGEAAVQALRSYVESERPHFLRPRRGVNTDALFLTRLGRRMTRQAFWKILGAYARATGIRKEIMLGHADIGTTEIYTHLSRAHLRTVYDRFHPRA